MNKIYAVVKVNTKTIKSKWYIKENGNLKDVTLYLFSDVFDYNNEESSEYKTFIPYDYKDGYITYSFGCGLTHYLQNNNISEVTTLNVNHIDVWTTNDLKMYSNTRDWQAALEMALKERGEL